MFLQYLWDLMNDLSFLMILTLISLNTPSFPRLLQSSLLDFIYFDGLLTEMWLPHLFFTDEDEPVNAYFEANGYGSRRLLVNMGSTAVFLTINVALQGLSWGLKGLHKICKCKR